MALVVYEMRKNSIPQGFGTDEGFEMIYDVMVIGEDS